jgi:hypothetical protein
VKTGTIRTLSTLGLFGIFLYSSVNTINRYKDKSEKYFNLYHDERDCRFALEVIWKRKIGDFIHNPGICDLDPYEEGCLCEKSLKNRKEN